MDLTITEIDGIAGARAFARRGSPARVLTPSVNPEESPVPLLHARTSGYRVKRAADHETVAALRAVSNGGNGGNGGNGAQRCTARSCACGRTKRNDAHATGRAHHRRLTERGRDELRLVADHSAREIGEQWHISPSTMVTSEQPISETSHPFAPEQ